MNVKSIYFEPVLRCSRLLLDEYYMKKWGISDGDTITVTGLNNNHHVFKIEILSTQNFSNVEGK